MRFRLRTRIPRDSAKKAKVISMLYLDPKVCGTIALLWVFHLPGGGGLGKVFPEVQGC